MGIRSDMISAFSWSHSFIKVSWLDSSREIWLRQMVNSFRILRFSLMVSFILASLLGRLRFSDLVHFRVFLTSLYLLQSTRIFDGDLMTSSSMLRSRHSSSQFI